MDTYCETSTIRRNRVDPKWEVLDAKGMQIKGVGSGLLGPRVNVLYRYMLIVQNGALGARVMDDAMMPDELGVMMGTVEQLEQATKFDTGNERLGLWALGATTVMEEAEILRARMGSRPMNILEVCAGMSGSYAVFRDLGCSIGRWHTIENEYIPNAVVGQLYAGRVNCVTRDVQDYSCRQWHDVFLADSPCQPMVEQESWVESKGFQ